MLIDEAWHLISRPETGEYANNLARRARHLGLVLIVMCQQLSDFDTDYGVALLGNCSQQLLLAQNPKEIPFIAETLQLSEREAAELARLKTVKGRHAQMLWLNGSRGRGKVALRVGPTEYWAFTSDPTEVAMREAEIDATTATCGRRSRRSRSTARAHTATLGAPGPARRWCRKRSLDERRPRAARTDRAPRKSRRLTVVVDERADTGEPAPAAEPNAAPPRRPAHDPSVLAQGPLLAVSGLCGGAGATTLAYLVATCTPHAKARAGAGRRHGRSQRRAVLLRGRQRAAIA